ncbi:YbaK/EbsC family protein [Cellulomonas sp. NPDC089187]|uniref:YbaK/EbsC family protein n=1 Tax=Cellulomonas sp. NPDC089187 TaxID=3154970 RepID=UPI0034155822
MGLGTLDWQPAVDHLDLLAPATAAAITAWADTDPDVATDLVVAAIDPELADTAALTEAYDLPLSGSGNCVLVAGRRGGEERIAAAVVRATTRADVNATIKRLLDVRKASFLPMDRAVQESGMEYGGITPIGVPADYRVLIDSRVVAPDPDAGDLVVIGSGRRRSKLALPAALLARLPGAEVIEGLALA